MRSLPSETTLLSISATLRWMALLLSGLLLNSRGLFTPTLGLILFAGGAWNAFLTYSLLQTKPFERLKLTALIVDFVLSLMLFYVAGTLLGPLAWAGLLPVIGAFPLFGLRGTMGVAVGTMVIFGLIAVIDVPVAEIPVRLAFPLFGVLAVGLALGNLNQRVHSLAKLGEPKKEIKLETVEQSERDRIKMLYEITETINSSLVFDQVLELALDLGTKALIEPPETVTHAVGGILLFHEGGLRVAAARGLAATDLGRILPGEKGALGDVLKTGEAWVLGHSTRDDEFGLISGLQNTESLYCVPLRYGLDLFGAMFFAHPKVNFFNEEGRELIDLLARQVMGALQNAQLYEALNEEKDRIANIQEQARYQLARNLHDGPTQSVAAIAMRVNLARRLLAKDPVAAGEELYKLEELARRTTKEIRHMLFTLHPQALENEGLVEALNDLIKHTEDAFDQQIQLEAEEDAVGKMDLGRQGVLFYIVAEALTNARKHSQAQNIAVRVTKAELGITLLEVEDDGVGFSPQEADAKRAKDGAVGLENMRERVELINGILRIDSKKGAGTKVAVWAPLNEMAAQKLRQGK
ncbi:MAG: histidine kinase [Anaerolineales bacterium]